MSDEHRVIGGGTKGAIIVSQTSEPVDFARILTNRVGNLVPVDDLEIPIDRSPRTRRPLVSIPTRSRRRSATGLRFMARSVLYRWATRRDVLCRAA